MYTSEKAPAQLSKERLAVAAVAVLLCACLVAAQVRNLVGFTHVWTDEDQALIWLAARELLHLHLYQPNFWGQNYGTTFEAWPGALLHLIGLPFQLSVPLGDVAIVTGGWLVVAFGAVRRGCLASALIALALPTLLSSAYLLAADEHAGFLAGQGLAALTVAAAVGVARPFRRLGIVIGLGWMSFLWDHSVLIAVLPAVVIATLPELSILRAEPRRVRSVVLIAAAGPVAWMIFTHIFYLVHPTWVSGRLDTTLSAQILWQNLTHPELLFAFYSPELLRWAWLGLASAVAVIIWAGIIGWRTQHRELTAAAAVFGALLLLTLAIRDTQDAQPGLFQAGGRFLLAMPLAMWLMAHQAILARSTRMYDHRGWWSLHRVAPAAVFLLLVAVVSEAAGQMRFTTETAQFTPTALGPSTGGVDLVSTSGLTSQCDQTAKVYASVDAQWLVSNFAERAFSYGCAAVAGINTIYPVADRRHWVLNAALKVPADRLLLQGGTDEFTDEVPSAGLFSTEPGGLVLLVTPRRPPAQSLKLMKVQIEPRSSAPMRHAS